MHGFLRRSPWIPLRSFLLLSISLATISSFVVLTATYSSHVEVDWEQPPTWWPTQLPDDDNITRIRLQFDGVPFRHERRQDDAVPWSPVAFLETPRHRIAVHPASAELPPSAPRSEHLLFAFTTTAARATQLNLIWDHFLRHGSHCLVVIPPEESDQRAHLQQLLGTRCTVRTSRLAGYEQRVGSVVIEATEQAKHAPDVRWLIVCDDDTYTLDVRVLRRMLSRYAADDGTPNGDHFIGGVTESVAQWGAFGRQAYGGAGIFISMQLVRKMAARFDDCLAAVAGVWTGGDGVLTYCAALVKQEDHHLVLQDEPGLHQMDVPGDGTGFFQSGLPFTTVHHFYNGWTDFFPKHCGLPPTMHEDLDAIKIISDSVNFLGGDNLFSRYVFDDGKSLLTLGYTLSVLTEPLTPDDLKRMEYTWSYDGYNLSFPQRGNLREGIDKVTYYLESTDATRGIQSFLTCDGQRLQISMKWP